MQMHSRVENMSENSIDSGEQVCLCVCHLSSILLAANTWKYSIHFTHYTYVSREEWGMQISRRVRARMITRVIVCLLLSIYDKDTSYTKVYTFHALLHANEAGFFAKFSQNFRKIFVACSACVVWRGGCYAAYELFAQFTLNFCIVNECGKCAFIRKKIQFK